MSISKKQRNMLTMWSEEHDGKTYNFLLFRGKFSPSSKAQGSSRT